MTDRVRDGVRQGPRHLLHPCWLRCGLRFRLVMKVVTAMVALVVGSGSGLGLVSGWGLGLSVGLALTAATSRIAHAEGEDDEDVAIEEATNLNKKALQEYDSLNFEVARKLLEEALDLCTKRGLANHPIKARTHVHMAVVIMAGGPSEHDEAIRQFRKALAIQPDIKLTSRIANPEVQNAFNEARRGAGIGAVGAPGAGGVVGEVKPPKGRGEVPTEGGPGNAPSTPSSANDSGLPSNGPSAPTPTTTRPAPEIPAVAPSAGLSHDTIRSAPQGTAIPVGVTTESRLAAKRVVVWFRPEKSPSFGSLPLREYSTGNWSGSIPSSATAGDGIAYYITAENGAGQTVAQRGSAASPLVVTLKPAPPPREQIASEGEEAEESETEEVEEKPTWYLALGLGTGFGWSSGNGDINHQDKVTSRFGASWLGHAVPEVGYFLRRDLILSVQLRLQLVSGATPERDVTNTMCGSDHVCDPAKGAVAGFARLTWILGQGKLVPFVSVAAGGGQIRHLTTFPKGVTCGRDLAKPMICVDTVTAGPILLGPGVGVLLRASESFGLTLGMNTVLGFPHFTLHADLNLGMVIEL